MEDQRSDARRDIDGQASTDRPTAQRHIPVLLDQCLTLLAPALKSSPREGGPVLVDGTLGMGGHSEAALARFPSLRVIGIDRDPQAIELATERLGPFGPRFTPVLTTYDTIPDTIASLGIDDVDGILLDLGVSSLQLDEAERGFSYAHDAPLDMRMNPQVGRSAAQLLAEEDEREIARILRVYGEEKFASKIAREIVSRRQKAPLTRTSELSQLVKDSIPAPARRSGGNPSKRTFQALRIGVNDELTILERAIPCALESLRIGGRIVVEAYQSLEDRIVKNIFRQGAQDNAPSGLPVVPEGMGPRLSLLTRKAVRADEAELHANPRSAPVRLRGAELIRPWKDNT
ncbi:16S rRNA (cytosine(1402)-N(4))-methyltransferase RsmH [Schaalia sp. ZJ405]|uniref:16S rRNA (cytosine(1402)-N(4))-methyltransferase RsmH n=1 Tax=Schaalia sp. ZJ405 TaxID=2709403 RepID=UPI0013EB7C36|nr:16S rRNA (cytosine(1402)-N(4))-methyltransferase RsmH [Schaalia sp. ZJ405]QPK81863.1 16S rRNA (cytosine(1402)-N(4))-methyltransferase RsmH [Schaalia sp. ZJ405]